MNHTSKDEKEYKSKAEELLIKMHEREKERDLVPFKISRNTSIMIPRCWTKKQKGEYILKKRAAFGLLT